MQNRFKRTWLIPVLPLLAIALYYLPPIHSRLAWRLDNLRTRIVYLIKPPDEAVFQPGGETSLTIETVIATTRAEYALTLTPQATSTPNLGPTPTPTITTTPLPATVKLDGVKYEDQHGRTNYCGPANFSMALTFWGWDGNRDVVGQAVMPGNTSKDGLPINVDKNVMPYELQEYIAGNVPNMGSVLRYGGDLNVVKTFLAAGIPVLVEKGIHELDLSNRVSWMGHYAFVTGYDDAQQMIIYQDSYHPAGAPPGPNRKIPYNEFVKDWRAFNYVFIVVYPKDRENTVMDLLGELANEETANHHALKVAEEESVNLAGEDRYFAWFNTGTSHIALLEYIDAATAYDQAFAVYATLGGDNTTRPYRMMWYQTGPYWAYYYSGRYADVINLANTTLEDTISEPVLEESLLWRGRALYMAGDTQSAINDYRAALKVHPKWGPAVQALQDLGVQP
ncbi:MAG: C39 family peptidase [Chloroflexi bacterium]|nr:C39 family peptidase [Chloroflexota bacterium]